MSHTYVQLSVCLQGDTVQGVASELSCVLESGFYCFHFKSSVDFVSGAVQLKYFPHIYQNVKDAREEEPVVWNEEQIEDFVRKLGFLDSEGDSASQIRRFLHHNQVGGARLGISLSMQLWHGLQVSETLHAV